MAEKWAVTYEICHHHPRACFINNSWLAATRRVKDRKINPQLKDLAALLLVEEKMNYKWRGASARHCCVVHALERKGLQGEKGSSHMFTGTGWEREVRGLFSQRHGKQQQHTNPGLSAEPTSVCHTTSSDKHYRQWINAHKIHTLEFWLTHSNI